MIAKGVIHRDGAILARYLVTGKARERAELWELRGFACTGIVAAFRSVHVIAAATKCVAPFFHLAVRNRDEERLDRSQWEYAANSIERMLGLTDQPRAVAFHTAEDTGHSHMHIVWSRINEETLTAKPLPFFKQRLKQVCRELEERFGLTPVPNQREGSIRFAPTRGEEEQARRLQVDVHATRETIRDCFERSDCGRSFRDALAQEGFVLARGDRRDFLVVDGAGGMYALGKRILGVSAAEIRNRLADLGRDHLPTLEQARELISAKRQGSPDNKLDDVCSLPKAAPKPLSERKQTRDAGNEKTRRAAGKKQPLDQVRKQLTNTHSMLPLDHLLTDTPASSDWSVSEGTPIDQLRNETPEPPGNAPQIAELLCAITGQQAQIGGPLSPDETVGPELAIAALPDREIPLSVPKTPSLAARLRDQFRALVKQPTARDPAPLPTSRKRRREEIGGGFRKAAWCLRGSVARIPPLHFLDPAWEPFTWLRLWEYNDPRATDFHHEHCTPTLSNQSPHL
jgi:hypothetical protein